MPGFQDHDRKSGGGYSLADVVEAQLKGHMEEDQRIFKAIFSSIETMSKDIKDINKLIWIATGVMLALSKGIDIFLNKHGL